MTAQVGDVYQLRYPNGYTSLTNWLFSPLRLQLFGWIPGMHLECLGVRSLHSQLLFMLSFPAAGVLAIVLLKWLQTRRFLPALPYVFWWTYFVHPSVSSKGFQVLGGCTCFTQHGLTDDNDTVATYMDMAFGGGDGSGSGGGNRGGDDADGDEAMPRPLCYLRADVSVACEADGTVPMPLRRVAWVMVLGFGLCVPLFHAALLVLWRRNRLPHAHAAAFGDALAFLRRDFHSSVYLWPLVEASRVLLLTGFAVFVPPAAVDSGSTVLRIFCGLVVALCALVLQAWCAPYKLAGDNYVAFVAATSLVFVFLSSLGLELNNSYGGETCDVINGTALSAILYAASLFVFPLTLAIWLLATRHRVSHSQLRELLLNGDEAADPADAMYTSVTRRFGDFSISASAVERALSEPLLSADELAVLQQVAHRQHETSASSRSVPHAPCAFSVPSLAPRSRLRTSSPRFTGTQWKRRSSCSVFRWMQRAECCPGLACRRQSCTRG